MNKVIRYSLLILCLGFMASIVLVSEAKAQGPLGEILRRMDLNNQNLKTLRAGVTMDKFNPQLNTHDLTVGSSSYLSKTVKGTMYVRIDWTKPVQEQVSVIGDNYELYRPRLNQVIQGKTNQAKNSGSAGNALAFMTMSKDQLKANYDVSYLGEEQISGGVKTWHLRLIPKGKTNYKSAELWVDGDGMPRQAKVIETNDDTTTVLLSDIQKNITINGSDFKLAYDKKKVKFIKA